VVVLSQTDGYYSQTTYYVPGVTENVHSSLESAAPPLGHLCGTMREMRPKGEGNAGSEAKSPECWLLDASLSDDRAKRKHQPEISGG